MDEQVINLLRKYLDNQCTADELEQVRTILRSARYDEEWAVVLQEDAEKNVNKNIPGVLDEDKAGKLLERIVTSVDISHENRNRNFFKTPLFAAAASILILLTAGIAFFMVSIFLNNGSELKAVTMAGEQTVVLLPDGTRIWLKDQSTLTYSDEFDGDTRTVLLEGGAFFDVVSNASQPFLVRTDGLTIRVLGTSFDVSAYKNDQDVTVSVASGSVRVTGPGDNNGIGETALNTNDGSINTLLPGDQLAYDKLNRKYFRQTMALNDIRALNEGRLIFQNQTLGDIVHALERRYNIQFRVEEELTKEQRMTFKPNSSNLDEVLEVLGLVSGLEIEKNKDMILMK